MTYPCIPVWMKEKPKDPFDYPLRTKKEIMFDQEISPPLFPINIVKTEYQDPIKMRNVQTLKADYRNENVKIRVDIRTMGLGPLQKKRLLFLLGPRCKDRKTLTINVRQYNNYEHNMIRASDILKQLYWEAKRAPVIIWEKMRPKERRKLIVRVLGKTKEIREMKKEELKKEYDIEVVNFEKLFTDEKNLTYEAYKERIKKRGFLDKFKSEEDIAREQEQKGPKITLEESLKDFKKDAIKRKSLTPKAYKLFFEKNEEENKNI
jgi:hypothetical protein